MFVEHLGLSLLRDPTDVFLLALTLVSVPTISGEDSIVFCYLNGIWLYYCETWDHCGDDSLSHITEQCSTLSE